MGRDDRYAAKGTGTFVFLAASPNQVFTREQLLDHIWGYEYIGDTRTVDVHIKRLREKIKRSSVMVHQYRLGHRLQIRG